MSMFFFLAGNKGLWDFRQNKFEVSGIYVWSFKDFWQQAPLQQCLMVESVNDVWYKLYAVIEFLVAEKESVRSIHKCLCNIYGIAAVERGTIAAVDRGTIAAVDRGTIGHWWKDWWLLKQEKQITVINLTQAVLLQLLDLKFCSVLMPLFERITAWQLDWRSVLQSAKEMLVTSFKILVIWRCAWEGFLGASQSNIKLIEKQFLLSCWHVLKLRERPSYLGLSQQMKLGSIILNWRQKGNP